MSKTNHRDGTKARQDFPSGYRLLKGSLKHESHLVSRRASSKFAKDVCEGTTDALNTPPVQNRHYGNPWHWD